MSKTISRAASRWSHDGGARPVATTQIGVPPDAERHALDPSLKGAWRTPSLRDVALTAPYMHDGYYQTLTEVVQHYNMGGVAGAGDHLRSAGAVGRGDAGTVVLHGRRCAARAFRTWPRRSSRST